MRGTELVLIHRPQGGQNRFGETSSWTPPRQVPGCIILPREAPGVNEPGGVRQGTVIMGLTVYAPPGTDVTATDEVTARGERWRVDGEPGDYRSAGGRRKIVAVNLIRAKG